MRRSTLANVQLVARYIEYAALHRAWNSWISFNAQTRHQDHSWAWGAATIVRVVGRALRRGVKHALAHWRSATIYESRERERRDIEMAFGASLIKRQCVRVIRRYEMASLGGAWDVWADGVRAIKLQEKAKARCTERRKQ